MKSNFKPNLHIALNNFAKELPYITAYLYMKIYVAFRDNPKTVQYIPSNLLLNMTHKEFPSQITQLLNQHPERIDKKDAKQINELYTLYKNGGIGGSRFLKLAEQQIKICIEIERGITQHRINIGMRQSFELGAGDILRRIQSLRKLAQDMAGVFPPDPNHPGYKALISDIDQTIEQLRK